MKRKENGKERKSKKSFLSSEIRLQISRSIANPKPGFYNLNPDFPVECSLSKETTKKKSKSAISLFF